MGNRTLFHFGNFYITEQYLPMLVAYLASVLAVVAIVVLLSAGRKVSAKRSMAAAWAISIATAAAACLVRAAVNCEGFDYLAWAPPVAYGIDLCMYAAVFSIYAAAAIAQHALCSISCEVCRRGELSLVPLLLSSILLHAAIADPLDTKTAALVVVASVLLAAAVFVVAASRKRSQGVAPDQGHAPHARRRAVCRCAACVAALALSASLLVCGGVFYMHTSADLVEEGVDFTAYDVKTIERTDIDYIVLESSITYDEDGEWRASYDVAMDREAASAFFDYIDFWYFSETLAKGSGLGMDNGRVESVRLYDQACLLEMSPSEIGSGNVIYVPEKYWLATCIFG